MAPHPHDFAKASHPFTPPLVALLSIIPTLPRPFLNRLVERAIERLDEIDGDCDLEDGDPSGQRDEGGINTGTDCVFLHGRNLDGAGCPISDPGEG